MKKTKSILISIFLFSLIISCDTRIISITTTEENTDEGSILKIPLGFLYPIEINNKWGYIDSTGNVIVKPIYEYANDFENGTGVLFSTKDTILIIDSKGKVVTKAIIDNPNNSYANYNSENLLLVLDTATKKYGYKNIEGKWIIKPKYESARCFSNGLAAITESLNIHPDTNSGCGTAVPHPQWGFINTKGDYVVTPKYHFVSDFLNGYSVTDNGIIDTKGKNVEIENVKDTRFLYYRFQFIERLLYGNKNWWIPNNPENFTNGYIVFKEKKSKKYGYLDWKGNIVIKAKYNNPSTFSENLSGVSLDNGKWGVIDTNDRMIIKPKFDFILPFSEGVAAAMLGKKWGFIDKKGEYIINPLFDERETLPTSYYFHGGLARVYLKSKMCYVNRNGKIIWTGQ